MHWSGHSRAAAAQPGRVQAATSRGQCTERGQPEPTHCARARRRRLATLAALVLGLRSRACLCLRAACLLATLAALAALAAAGLLGCCWLLLHHPRLLVAAQEGGDGARDHVRAPLQALVLLPGARLRLGALLLLLPLPAQPLLLLASAVLLLGLLRLLGRGRGRATRFMRRRQRLVRGPGLHRAAARDV